MSSNRPAVVVETSPIPLLPSEAASLTEALADAGFDVTVKTGVEERGNISEIVLLVWAAEKIGGDALHLLFNAIVGWVGSRRRRRLPTRIKILLGPDGDVAREVEVPAVDEED